MDRIEKAICKLLEPTLKRHGFELRKNWGYFVKEQSYGFDALLIVNQGTALGRFFEINFSFRIRHDQVEVPWNTLGLIYGEDARKETTTLGLLTPRGRQAVPLKVAPESMEEDIPSVAREIEATFTQVALPFYQRFSDLEEIEELANKAPLADIDPYGVGGPMEHRAMRSLLLAKAVNPERYAAVRDTFLTLDKGMFPHEKRMEMLRRVDEMQL